MVLPTCVEVTGDVRVGANCLKGEPVAPPTSMDVIDSTDDVKVVAAVNGTNAGKNITDSTEEDTVVAAVNGTV